MSHHEMAYQMAHQGNPALMARRDYRTGSVYQRCESRFGCPSPVDGERPKHKCKGRWFGVLDAGYTASGTRRRVTVSAKTEAEAKRRFRDKRLEMEREGHRQVKRTVTVARWAETWLEDIQTQVRPSAYETDKAAVRAIVAAIGSHKLSDVGAEEVRAVAKRLRQKGKSTSTALRYHGSLIRMLKAASVAGYAIQPNALLASKPKAAVNDREATPLADALRVLEHVANLPDGSRWALAFLQGLRQAEALGLTWEQVDLDNETLTISWQLKSLRYLDRSNPSLGFEMPDGYEARHLVGATHLVRPKSKAGWRVIPLVPWAVMSLRTWQQVSGRTSGLVWPGRSVRGQVWPRNAASDRAEWEAIQTTVGIAHPAGYPFKVHEIRHGTATLLMELGVGESERVAIMGHSSMAVTRGYEHVDLARQRQALLRAAERLALTTSDQPSRHLDDGAGRTSPSA